MFDQRSVVIFLCDENASPTFIEEVGSRISEVADETGHFPQDKLEYVLGENEELAKAYKRMRSVPRT